MKEFCDEHIKRTVYELRSSITRCVCMASIKYNKEEIEDLKRHLVHQAEEAANSVELGISGNEMMLARAGRKIMAIKEHRDRTGLGLKEAKDVIEKWMQENL